MASSKPLSSSIRKGQTALVCELCENDPKLKWKCLDCGLMMCQRCRDKVHPKFPSAQDHTIIDIKDVHKYQEEQKLDFTKLKCPKHAGQNCCLFCKSCEELVCPICISKTHNKHEMTEISEGYKIQVDKIRKIEKKITGEIQTLSKGQEELRKIKFLEQTSINKSKKGILDYKKSLIYYIEEHCDKLLSELDRDWGNISQSIDRADQKSKENQKTLLQKNDEVNEVLQSNDAMKVFSSSHLTKPVRKKTEPVQNTFNHAPKFVPGDLSKISILHGRLETVPYNEELIVSEQWTTNFNSIHKMIVCEDDTFWIYEHSLKVVLRVKQEGSSIKVLSNFKLDVNDMTLTPSGDLLLCVFGSSVVKVIQSGTGVVKDSPYNVSPLWPVSIHVTQDNKVIIGGKDTGSYFPANGPRQVIVLNQLGQQEKVFQYDNHNKPLFTLPVCITSTSNNNIGVIDMISEDKQGRVVILDNEGRIISIYTGHPDVNTDNPFEPRNIITTPSENFVTADYINHTLHILSSDGEIITYYNTEELGIDLPFSLSFSQTGQLYIGCGTYKKSRPKAKIYKIDNFLL